jgi:hypothetical protein
MMRGDLKRLLSVAGLAGLVAMIVATAALAQAEPVYCLNGTTTTMPAFVPYAGNVPGAGVSLGPAGAEGIIGDSSGPVTFYVGLSKVLQRTFLLIADGTINPETFYVPGYSTNSISRGACAATAAAHVGVPGASFMCGAAYGARSHPDYVAGRDATSDYLAGAGRHYAFYVQGDLNGVQRAQAAPGTTPAGSFYCSLPESLRAVPIMGSDGKQMLADTQGYLYESGYANGETIGHPAYRLGL